MAGKQPFFFQVSVFIQTVSLGGMFLDSWFIDSGILLDLRDSRCHPGNFAWGQEAPERQKVAFTFQHSKLHFCRLEIWPWAMEMHELRKHAVQRGSKRGKRWKNCTFLSMTAAFCLANNLRREQKSGCLLNAKPQKHGAFLSPARRKLYPGILEDSPADWGHPESNNCPQSPFHWVEPPPPFITQRDMGLGRPGRPVPDWTKPEGSCNRVRWLESKALMHIDALLASRQFSWPEESVKKSTKPCVQKFWIL